jgi:hypothetical protein
MIEQEQQRLRQARRAIFEEYRRLRLSAWIAPRGRSMRPLIGSDTWMLVEFGAPAVAVGDIIVFPLGDMLVAHRVVARRWRQGAEWLIAKGDAEPYYDPAVRSSDVLGVVRALRRRAAAPVQRYGCSGLAARAIAHASRLGGRGAWLARRLAAFLPDPLRRMALRAIPPFARVTAHLLYTPLHWAVWFQRKQFEQWEGGEQHEAIRAPGDPRDLHSGRVG